MSKNKKARRAEAMKKAKQKKMIVAAICISAAVVFAALIIFISLQSGVRSDADGILDLTRSSMTMLLSQVNRIAENPNNYIDQTIKMNGLYYAVYNERFGRIQHYIAAREPDPCCPLEGFEFISNGGLIYPDNTKRIEVTGVFTSYEEFGQIYYYLEVDDIIVLD